MMMAQSQRLKGCGKCSDTVKGDSIGGIVRYPISSQNVPLISGKGVTPSRM
jgi:hypothetical protein